MRAIGCCRWIDAGFLILHIQDRVNGGIEKHPDASIQDQLPRATIPAGLTIDGAIFYAAMG